MPVNTLLYILFPSTHFPTTFSVVEYVVKSILAAVTAPSAIAAVVTELAGKGAFNRSPRVIFLVTEADVSTIASSSELSAVVSDGNCDSLGRSLPSLSYYIFTLIISAML